jgi:thiol-disulfide isomerase/thioredoxin
MSPRTALPLLLATVLSSGACATAGPAKPQREALVGPITREQVEADSPEWVEAVVSAQPDAEMAKALAAVEPGAEVTVFLGTWCGDSRREVPRFWRALDETGGLVPFEIHYVGVSRDKKEPGGPVSENGILYVPTFIVRRDGREVGRIVEDAPGGIESDLLALLTGKAQGLITSRTDLSSENSAAPPPQ